LRIVIPTTGSRGDVQPFVALGVGLRALGHEVRVATDADFGGFIREAGLDFFPIATEARPLHDTAAGQKMRAAGSNPFVFLRHFGELREPRMSELLANCWQACRDADMVLLTPTAFLLGYSVAEKADLPLFSASYLPTASTGYLANFLFPDLPPWVPAPRLYNLLSHVVAGEFLWQGLRRAVNRARRDVLTLPPLSFLGPSPRLFHDLPVVYGYSHLVIPRPPDWNGHQHVTGFWFLETAGPWQPPAALAAFLAAGPPPIYIGFGSMSNGDAGCVTGQVIEARRRTGQRGILGGGWGGLARPPDSGDLFYVESVPHD